MPFVADINESLGTAWVDAGWVDGADYDTVAFPNMNGWIDASSPDPSLAGFVLFGNWGDGGPGLRSRWRQKLYTGFTPGQEVGVHIGVSWGLFTPGSSPQGLFLSIEGGDGSNYRDYVPENTSFSFWTIPSNFPNIRDNVLQGIADVNGEVLIKTGAINMGGSCNLSAGWGNQVIEAGHFVGSAYGYVAQTYRK